MRLRCSIMVAALFLLSALPALAQIDFDGNDIDFVKPHTIGKTGTVEPTEPAKTRKSDGFEIGGLSYKFTAGPNDTGTYMVEWSASRMFMLAEDSDIQVTITGETDVNNMGEFFAAVDIFVTGTLDNLPVAKFELQTLPRGVSHVMWNTSGTAKGVKAGQHILDMESGITFKEAHQGDMVTVTSLYGVGAAVPEPAHATGMSLAIAVCGLAIWRGRRHRRLQPADPT